MSSSNIQVFVYFGMSGRRTATFNVTPDTSVASFLKSIVDKEGAEGVRVIYGGKQLDAQRNGRTMILSDYGINNGATCHAALRLKGGAAPKEGNTATVFNHEKVKKLGGLVVDTDCILGLSDGCYESNIKKCKLPCGCIYCADCMKYYINLQITVGLEVKINCGDSSHGNNELDLRLAYEVATLPQSEREAKNQILSQNLFKRGDACMSICPQQKCQMYVMRNGTDLKQKCDACQKCMCWNWSCKREWKGGAQGCGNDNCDPFQYYSLLLGNAQKKKIDNIEVPDTRICPKCYEVNIHSDGCKKMTCKGCRQKYCHICCKLWDNGCGYGITCQAAPEQKFTKDMLKK